MQKECLQLHKFINRNTTSMYTSLYICVHVKKTQRIWYTKRKDGEFISQEYLYV